MDIQTYKRLTDREKMEVGLSQARAASIGASVISGVRAAGEAASLAKDIERGLIGQNKPSPKLSVENLRQIKDSIDQALESLDRV